APRLARRDGHASRQAREDRVLPARARAGRAALGAAADRCPSAAMWLPRSRARALRPLRLARLPEKFSEIGIALPRHRCGARFASNRALGGSIRLAGDVLVPQISVWRSAPTD